MVAHAPTIESRVAATTVLRVRVLLAGMENSSMA
jgi:hypothetical protein